MLVQCFSRSLPIECLPRTGVERCGDGFNFVATPPGQVSALGEVLAQEPIRVLVGSSLPRAMRVGEVDGEAGVDLQLDVLSEFFASVPSLSLIHISEPT